MLEWAISQNKGRVYVHCTAGLGRAPAVAIAYMFWFCGLNVSPVKSQSIYGNVIIYIVNSFVYLFVDVCHSSLMMHTRN